MELKFKKPPKRYVNAFVAWSCSACCLLVFLMAAVGLADGAFWRLIGGRLGRVSDIAVLAVFTASLAYVLACRWAFEWYLNQRVEVSGGKVVYRYEVAVKVAGNATTSYTVYSVDSVKDCGSSVLVYGDIDMKEPLHNKVKVGKCKIYGLYDASDKEKVLGYLGQLVEACYGQS